MNDDAQIISDWEPLGKPDQIPHAGVSTEAGHYEFQMQNVCWMHTKILIWIVLRKHPLKHCLRWRTSSLKENLLFLNQKGPASQFHLPQVVMTKTKTKTNCHSKGTPVIPTSMLTLVIFCLAPSVRLCASSRHHWTSRQWNLVARWTVLQLIEIPLNARFNYL